LVLFTERQETKEDQENAETSNEVSKDSQQSDSLRRKELNGIELSWTSLLIGHDFNYGRRSAKGELACVFQGAISVSQHPQTASRVLALEDRSNNYVYAQSENVGVGCPT
jgi:hypothetical protein